MAKRNREESESEEEEEVTMTQESDEEEEMDMEEETPLPVEEEEKEEEQQEEEEEEEEEPKPKARSVKRKVVEEEEMEKPKPKRVKSRASKRSSEESDGEEVEKPKPRRKKQRKTPQIDEEELAAAKERERIEQLKASAHENWMSFLKDVGGGANLSKQLFTGVSKESVHVQTTDKNGKTYVNGRYWLGPDRKKSASLCKWLHPCYVKYEASGGDGNYDPKSDFSNTYKTSRFVLYFSETLPADFVEELDKEWVLQDPETRGPAPHELWRDSCIGTFEHLMDLQEALLESFYNSPAASDRKDGFRKNAVDFVEGQMKNNKSLKGMKRGDKQYKQMVEDTIKNCFMNTAKRPIAKLEDGSYELRTKRRVFSDMSPETKAKWEAGIKEARARGDMMEDAPEEIQPFLSFMERKPLRIVDCERKFLPQPKDYKTPRITRGAMAMEKIYFMPFNNGDVYGISAQISSWKNEEEIILFRAGPPADAASNEPKPQFVGAEPVQIEYEVEDENSNVTNLFINKYMRIAGSSQHQPKALPSSGGENSGPRITHVD